MPKIIIVEPHPLLRLGLVQLLSDIVPDSSVTGADYANMTRDGGATDEPDLVLLAVTSCGNLYKLAADALTAYSPKSILLMSDSDDMPDLPHGLPSRVTGYISRHAAPQVLQASVRLVLAGGTCYPRFAPPSHGSGAGLGRGAPAGKPYASMEGDGHASSILHTNGRSVPSLKQATVSTGSSEQGNSSRTPARGTHQEWEMLGLTPRQYEVLILLARGHSMKMVGRQLNISAATAKAHAEALYQRLDVHNRNAAVYAAVSRGATLGWSSIAAADKEIRVWAET
jgi:DNA-binding NarL/FixJ family response regulator